MWLEMNGKKVYGTFLSLCHSGADGPGKRWLNPIFSTLASETGMG